MMGIEDTPKSPEERIADLERRVKELEDHLTNAVEAALSRMFQEPSFDKAMEQGQEGAVPEPIVDITVEGAPCPDHPDATQTENGCTAPGCTHK